MKNNIIILKNCIIIISLLFLAFNSNSQNIYTFAGTGNPGYSGDGGQALLAEITAPTGIVNDKKGNVYFCDWYYGKIRKVATNGIITTIAGNGSGTSALVDSIPAINALTRHPWGLSIDSIGNLYFAEAEFNQVRKIDTNGVIITIAGAAYQIYQGQGYFSGDGGPAKNAQLNKPYDVAIDTYGNIYIADANNNRIRKVDTNGIITTIAGINSAGFSGDGGLAVSAELKYPYGVAVDNGNNIYIGDTGNRRVRKIDGFGIITTFAGNGSQSNTGDGGLAIQATMGSPSDIYVNATETVFIIDNDFGTARSVDVSNIIHTVAGSGSQGYSGDGSLATSAQMIPRFISSDNFGNLYITDDKRVRIVCYNSCATNLNEFNNKTEIKIYPNPATNTLQISDENNAFQNATIQIKNYLGQVIFTTPFTSQINLQNLTAGIYFLTVKDKDYEKTVKIIKD